MAEHSAIFKELSYVFIAAILGGALAWRLRQPLILGYVVAGIALSPFTPGPAVREAHTFQIVAEVGVVFLMFSIGLEFSIEELLEVKWVSLVGAPLGVVLLSAIGAGIGRLAGWGATCGMVMGMIVSVASTMVLSRLLIDSGQLQAEHGSAWPSGWARPRSFSCPLDFSPCIWCPAGWRGWRAPKTKSSFCW